MKTLKISVYLKSQFIRDILADFENKKEALSWVIEEYKSIGVFLNPKEITVVNL